MNEGYVYDEIKYAGQILHKQYSEMLAKYEFNIQLMEEDLGFDKTEDFLLNLVDVVPKFIPPYEDLCKLYSLYEGAENEFLGTEAVGFVISKSLVIDEMGDFPEVLDWGFMENRPIIRFLLTGADELWGEGRVSEARSLYEGLLGSNWMDNIGVRYNLLAIHQKMTFEDFQNKFVSDGYLSDEVEDWFEKGYKKVKLLVKWYKKITEMEE
ncbi:MAG: hypothetical protein ACJAZ2_001365 [Glaciecola sp.]|jgi:hypothetical protein